MSSHPIRIVRLLVVTLIAGGCVLHAQSAATIPASTDKAVVLDPFTVKSDSLEGYRALSSASGLGFAVQLDRLPIPITVLPARFLADSGVIKVEDALRFVSGVSNTGRSVATTESYAIRGFSTGNLLRDGEPFNTATDTVLIDRVEVLKGPGAIIYGTADPSGLVNIVQKQAFFKNETVLSATYAGDGTVHGLIDLNHVLSGTGEWRAALASSSKIPRRLHPPERIPRPNRRRPDRACRIRQRHRARRPL